MFSRTRHALNGHLRVAYRASHELHTGECEVRGADIGGIAVHIGARVRDLVIGSGQEFTDHGAHQLKGVPGDWRLFAVAS